jgi:hypothetical protein
VQDRLARGRRLLGGERASRQQHPGGAEAALDGAALGERLLHGVEASVTLEPFHRQHLASVRLDREIRARAHGGTVHQHRAGATHLAVAGALGALEPETVAQHVEQQRLGRQRQRRRSPVHAEGDVKRGWHADTGHRAHGPRRARPPRSRTRRVNTRVSSRL